MSFYCSSQKTRLDDSEKLIKILQSFHTRENWKPLDIVSTHFSIFNNTLSASWLGHITWDFFTCYSCLCIVPKKRHKIIFFDIQKHIVPESLHSILYRMVWKFSLGHNKRHKKCTPLSFTNSDSSQFQYSKTVALRNQNIGSDVPKRAWISLFRLRFLFIATDTYFLKMHLRYFHF